MPTVLVWLCIGGLICYGLIASFIVLFAIMSNRNVRHTFEESEI